MNELRDSKGLTEAEFLACYNPNKYPKPSLTADILVFSRSENGKMKLLMIKRRGHPFIGQLALPGGFANKNEELYDTALRELFEETNVKNLRLSSLGTFSRPNRDPRDWVVSEAFVCVCSDRELLVQAGDDAAEADWYNVELDRAKDLARLRIFTDSEGFEAALEIEEYSDLFGRQFKVKQLSHQGIAFDHSEIIALALLKLSQ